MRAVKRAHSRSPKPVLSDSEIGRPKPVSALPIGRPPKRKALIFVDGDVFAAGGAFAWDEGEFARRA